MQEQLDQPVVKGGKGRDPKNPRKEVHQHLKPKGVPNTLHVAHAVELGGKNTRGTDGSKDQQIENKNKQIEELTPDAESWRKFVDSDGTFTASNVAKLLHISRDNDLIPFLLLKKYIMRERHDNPKHAGNLVGTALGIERGYIKNYLYTNNKISRVQFKITPEGMQKIEKAFCHNELTPSEQRRVNALCQEAERKMKPTSIGRAE